MENTNPYPPLLKRLDKFHPVCYPKSVRLSKRQLKRFHQDIFGVVVEDLCTLRSLEKFFRSPRAVRKKVIRKFLDTTKVQEE